MMNLEDRIARVHSLRSQGFNCAQAVAMVFDDITGLDPQSAARICNTLGAGVACGEICGAALAASLVNGSRFPDDPSKKGLIYADSRRIMDAFKDANGGRIRCCELKGKPGAPSCNELVDLAVTLTHNHLSANTHPSPDA